VEFFVCNDVFEEWTKLPLISARDIREARRIKHIFTGDLETIVVKSPSFSSKFESILLKAQLVRIFYCTKIEPSGKYKISPDADEESYKNNWFELEEVEEELYKPPTH